MEGLGQTTDMLEAKGVQHGTPLKANTAALTATHYSLARGACAGKEGMQRRKAVMGSESGSAGSALWIRLEGVAGAAVNGWRRQITFLLKLC